MTRIFKFFCDMCSIIRPVYIIVLSVVCVSCKPERPKFKRPEIPKGPYAVEGCLRINGEPLLGMQVFLKLKWGGGERYGFSDSCLTDDSGCFMFSDLPHVPGKLCWVYRKGFREITRRSDVSPPCCLTNDLVSTSSVQLKLNIQNQRDYIGREVRLVKIDPQYADEDFRGSSVGYTQPEFELEDKVLLDKPSCCFEELPKGTYVITCNSLGGRGVKWVPALFEPVIVELDDGESKKIKVEDIPYYEL